MKPAAGTFRERSGRAIGDDALQSALGRLAEGFPLKRRNALDRLPEFEAMRAHARVMKDATLARLDSHLARFADACEAAGGHVHWCKTAADARAVITDICRKAGARTVTKGKSMISEEIGLNAHLAANGFDPVETDLGEYILQLRDEPPSHIIAPAIHLAQSDVATAFRAAHQDLAAERPLGTPELLLAEARAILRRKFLAADVGITGANLLIAETGTAVTVTNEGNAELTMTLPRVHIALTSIEKVVPTLDDAAEVLRLLARSATGQDFSVYTTFFTGPRRAGDPDGPEEFHVVLLDGGRSALLGSEFREMLRCIKCGACMNHCPVYAAVGGHAYGWVYPGPMGAVLTPWLSDREKARELPFASSLCGRCEAVCPMQIPLPGLLRAWRERLYVERPGVTERSGLRLWAWLGRHPSLYRIALRLGALAVRAAALGRGRARMLPGASAWTRGRDMPAPEGAAVHSAWREARNARRGPP
jgi:L-lactate dehydrogenase complex protein LldF